MFAKYFLLSIIAVVILIILWITYDNIVLDINIIKISSEHLPEKFDGFRIAQISDLHNKKFGKNNIKLISALKETKADIVVITGDFIDSRRTDVDSALALAEQIVKIAPTYYVSGNHESRVVEEYEKLKRGFAKLGVVVLDNSSVDITAGEDTISLLGIEDPNFIRNTVDCTMEEAVDKNLSEAMPDNENYKILLTHRTEYIDEYVGKVDLAFAGHAHGGQFILPFIGGVFAPGQGFFPKYYSGLYERGTTNMISSRGIGNSVIPVRINNRSVIVVAELLAENKE